MNVFVCYSFIYITSFEQVKQKDLDFIVDNDYPLVTGRQLNLDKTLSGGRGVF